MYIEPKKIDEEGALKRYFIASMLQVKANIFAFFVLSLFTMFVSYLVSLLFEVRGSSLIFLTASFYVFSLWAEVIYSSRRESYTISKFITSFILAFDFVVKFIKGNIKPVGTLISILIFIEVLFFILHPSDEVLKARAAAAAVEGTKKVSFNWQSLGWFWQVTSLNFSSVIGFYLWGLGKVLTDDYYYYRIAGAMRLKEVENPVPSNEVNRLFISRIKMVLMFCLIMTIWFPITSVVISIILSLILMQYSFETYGDDGDKLKAEEKKKKEIDNMLPSMG